MEISKELAQKIREQAEKEALDFYISFDGENEFSTYRKFIDYCIEHDDIPAGSSIWEPFEDQEADIDENIENHADYIENILTKFIETNLKE